MLVIKNNDWWPACWLYGVLRFCLFTYPSYVHFRMFSGSNNRHDYQLFFRTRGAFRPLGWNGLIAIVCILDVWVLLALQKKIVMAAVVVYAMIILLARTWPEYISWVSTTMQSIPPCHISMEPLSCNTVANSNRAASLKGTCLEYHRRQINTENNGWN